MNPQEFTEAYYEETIALLKELAAIPAPPGREEQRAAFIREWLIKQGAEHVMIDDAGNVLWMYPEKGNRNCPLTVLSVHMDVVFPDMEPFSVEEKEGRLYAPGVGDDTANLVNLLMTAKYLLEKEKTCPRMQKEIRPILFAANTGEEGLGNLKGAKEIAKVYGKEIRQWIALDLYLGELYNGAVGSQRYQVKVKTMGGHSYGDFGRENAIAQMAEVIHDLYHQPLPDGPKTTYNVGVMEGGTSVNAIAREACILYEFRSESAACMKKMEQSFQEILDRHRKLGKEIRVEILGVRPGKGNVEERKLKELTEMCRSLIGKSYGGTVRVGAASTDCNIPLSMGIPAVTVGTVTGGLLHTREEWVEKESMKVGQKLAIDLAEACLWMQNDAKKEKEKRREEKAGAEI